MPTTIAIRRGHLMGSPFPLGRERGWKPRPVIEGDLVEGTQEVGDPVRVAGAGSAADRDRTDGAGGQVAALATDPVGGTLALEVGEQTRGPGVDGRQTETAIEVLAPQLTRLHHLEPASEEDGGVASDVRLLPQPDGATRGRVLRRGRAASS